MKVWQVTMSKYRGSETVELLFQKRESALKWVVKFVEDNFDKTLYGDIRNLRSSDWCEYRNEDGDAIGEINLDEVEVLP